MSDPIDITDILRAPDLDAQGRIISGVYAGMTPDEVLAQRDRFNATSNAPGLIDKLRARSATAQA
jgi:hypothetical protein